MINITDLLSKVMTGNVVMSSGTDYFSHTYINVMFDINPDFVCILHQVPEKAESNISIYAKNSTDQYFYPNARFHISNDRLVINSTTANIDTIKGIKKKFTEESLEVEIVSLITDIGGSVLDPDMIRNTFKEIKEETTDTGKRYGNYKI